MTFQLAEKILNVSRHEIPRTIFAWGARLLHQTGFVIGLTATTAIFVTRFSVEYLPVMFLVQSVLTIMGMVLFSFLNDFFSTKFLMGASSLLAASCLLSATFVREYDFLFFGFLFVALGVFIPQFTIFLSSFLEDLFSPLEGERIFPLVESAHTLGGIFGGILITTLGLFIGSYKFFYVWILFLFLLMSAVIFLDPGKTVNHAATHRKRKAFSVHFGFETFREHFLKIQSVPFLQTLFVVFLLQWILGHLLEFQFTKVVEESISHTVSEESHQGSLAHGLGSFHILFYSSALAIQLLVASRLLNKLGVAGSFLLHGIVTFFSAVSLLIGSGFFTLVLAKNNFEISGVMQKNAYEGSYYALRHGTQRTVREFFEAFLYPIGTMVGTLLLLAIQWFFLEEHSLKIIQLLYFFLATTMVVISFHFQKNYTRLVKENLLDANDQLSKLHAIEILSQKGHARNVETLLKSLYSKGQSLPVQVKILSTLGKIGDMSTIPDLLSFFHSSEDQLVLSAVSALKSFPKLHDQIFSLAFARYRVIHELKELFLRTNLEQVRIEIIQVLSKFRDPEIVQFLLDVLHTASPSLQAAAIRACSFFRDSNAAFFIEPYLKSQDPRVKSQAIIALWTNRKYHHRLVNLYHQLLNSQKPGHVAAGLLIPGETSQIHEKQRLVPYLTSIDPELRLHACVSLLNLGYREAAGYFLPLLFSRHEEISRKAHRFLTDLKPEIQRLLTHLLKREVSRRWHYGVKAKQQPQFFTDLLLRLKKVYLHIESYHEADYIEDMLQNKLLPAQQPAFL